MIPIIIVNGVINQLITGGPLIVPILSHLVLFSRLLVDTSLLASSHKYHAYCHEDMLLCQFGRWNIKLFFDIKSFIGQIPIFDPGIDCCFPMFSPSYNFWAPSESPQVFRRAAGLPAHRVPWFHRWKHPLVGPACFLSPVVLIRYYPLVN